jgi:EAL domain-containing protein (putative c-di-GMP-specific phosphodiesterase class I)
MNLTIPSLPFSTAGGLAGNPSPFMHQVMAGHSDHHIGESAGDYASLMREVDFLLDRGFPLGVALVMGDIDASVCRQIKRAVARQADYLAWVVMGPVLVAIFRRGMFEELRRAWRMVTSTNADLAAGVVFSDSLSSHEELLAAARIALQRALVQRIDLVVLDPQAATRAIDDHKVAMVMKKHLAAGGGNFEAHFQPQVHLESGLPVCAEALARWSSEDEDIPPSRFIPIAEESGLIGEIGEMMLALSARALKVMRGNGIDIPHIAVNVSPMQSRQGDFLHMLTQILRTENLGTGDIELEITESLAGNGSEEFLDWLAELVAAGFRISIDDFGTGTSTLARIRHIPASKIKLDRAFVTAIPHDEAACTTCRSALDLVHGLGKTSLAEGVEYPAQAAYLSSLGCAMGQGFLWARPMPEAELLDWWNARVTTQ